MDIEALIQEIKSAPKYRDTAEETIRGLVAVEVGRHKKEKQVVKAVRKRLHNIMAFYLGDANYDQAETMLRQAFKEGTSEEVKNACRAILSDHPSTEERLDILDQFYDRIFEVTGQPEIMLDLACGINPLTYPWMKLPPTLEFHAYDIYLPRVNFINTFFELQGLEPLAEVKDVVFHPPQARGDVALILKELPRLDRNYQGAGLSLIQALQVRYVVLSFPVVSLHGGRDLTEHYRAYMDELVGGLSWRMTEILFSNELVYCLDKGR